uniref:Uncharacterized protein n=1 Tax=Rhizophora mucronata TaxID=61149 RepID=A0A2P2NBX7_RHIMU
MWLKKLKESSIGDDLYFTSYSVISNSCMLSRLLSLLKTTIYHGALNSLMVDL